MVLINLNKYIIIKLSKINKINRLTSLINYIYIYLSKKYIKDLLKIYFRFKKDLA